MKKPTKILIVDDHPLMAQATKELLAQMDDIEVTGIAGSGEVCLKFMEQNTPNMVFLDFHLPDQFGDELAKTIKWKYPFVHIVIFSGIDISDLLNHFIEIGVSGILSKELDGELIKNAVYCMLKNQTVLPIPIFHQMRLMRPTEREQLLTDDEEFMMSMVVRGYTNEQIGEEIHMSKRSVDNYLKKIYEKYNVKSRAQAIEKYLQRKA